MVYLSVLETFAAGGNFSSSSISIRNCAPNSGNSLGDFLGLTLINVICVLMALLKQLLPSTPHLRLVLMSATLDGCRPLFIILGIQHSSVAYPSRTFPVEDYFLEDVLLLTGYNPPKKPRKNRFGGGNRWKHKPRKSTPWNDSELSDHEEEEIGDDELSDNRVLGDSQIRGKNLNRMPLLVEVFASQASIQRRGRAGRVREGKCYKLIWRNVHSLGGPSDGRRRSNEVL